MEEILLEVKNLKVKAEKEEILKGVNLKIKKGEFHVLLGPNGSGKTVLVQTIFGNPKYKVIEGKIIFEGKNITKLSPEKRAKLGMALSWQNPPKIKGVKLSQLLKKISKKKVEIKEAEYLLDKEINVDISGGERKISELLQVLSLDPKFAVLDEIDSGLDIKKIEKVAEIIKKEFLEKKVSVLLITHRGEILNFLKPHFVEVMISGKVVCKSSDFKKILKTIKKYGYEKCRKCIQKI
jgi:Fe-S cluster assembly ATP-binding protein